MADSSMPTWSDFALQPQDCACLELRQGLVGLYVPALGSTGDRLYDLTGRKAAAGGVNTAWGSDVYGHHVHYDGTAYHHLGETTGYQGTEATFFVLVRDDHPGNNQSLFGCAADSDASTSRINVHFPYGGTIYWDYGRLGNGGRISKAAPSDWAMAWHTWAFQASGGNLCIYYDGKPWHSGAGDAAGYTGSSLMGLGCLLFGGAPSSYCFNGQIALFLGYHRALTPGEIAALHADPFCLVRRRRPRRPGMAFAAVGAPYRVAAAQIFHPGAAAGEPFAAGARAGQTFHAGQVAGVVAAD